MRAIHTTCNAHSTYHTRYTYYTHHTYHILTTYMLTLRQLVEERLDAGQSGAAIHEHRKLVSVFMKVSQSHGRSHGQGKGQHVELATVFMSLGLLLLAVAGARAVPLANHKGGSRSSACHV